MMGRAKAASKKVQLHGSVSEGLAREIEGYVSNHPLIYLNGLVGELIKKGWERLKVDSSDFS